MVVSYCFGGGTMLCREHALSNKKNMSKYIDTDSLRKEIGHRIDILADMSIKCAKNDDTEMHAYYHGKAISLQELLSFIGSFQQEQQKQPQVDLEKEIQSYDNYLEENGLTASLDAIARHFYELGKAAKED